MKARFLAYVRVCGLLHSVILYVDAITQIKSRLVKEENIIENIDDCEQRYTDDRSVVFYQYHSVSIFYRYEYDTEILFLA